VSFNSDAIAGKRIMALDYGERRTGVAVCDEMHIVVSSRPILETNELLIHNVLQQAGNDRVDVIVVGVPVHHDERITPIIQSITEFITSLAASTSIPVFAVDEAFSTRDARAIMVASGMKKKKRQTKGVKDQVAAAVILQRVLDEYSVRPIR
jgi:putative Holliday junction resolvase